MTQKVFLERFEKALLVAEPKRSEIIAELETHFDEQGDTAVMSLGDAKSLALRHNQTHLGFFSSFFRFILVTLSVWVVATLYTVFVRFDYEMYQTNPPIFFLESIGQSIITFLLPIIAAVILGHALGRQYRPQHQFFTLIALTFVLSVLNIMVSDYSGGVFYALGIGAFNTVILAVVAFAGTILGVPSLSKTYEHARRRFVGETIMLSIILAAGLLFSFVVAEFFAPYDLHPIEMRPPEGNWVREVNDFFEGSWGAFLFGLLILGMVARTFFRRFKRYQKFAALQKKQSFSKGN